MARGFGATLGVSTTDRLISVNTTNPVSETLSAWVYRNGSGGDTFGAVLESSDQRTIWGHDGSTTTMRYYRTWSSAPFAGWWTCPLPSSGAWHHLVVTYNGSSTTNDPVMYVDDVSQTVTEVLTPAGTVATDTSAWCFGNRAADQSKCWDGLLADVAGWSRMLTRNEIHELAAGRNPRTITTNLLEAITMPGTTTPLSIISGPTVTGTLGTNNDPPLIHSIPSPIGAGIFRT